jgi:predicted phage-related endonuclease
LGLKVGFLGCFHIDRSRQFFTVEIHFDEDWFAEMMAEADRFWTENILGDEIPLHDFRHPITEGLLKEQHPTVIQPSTDLPDLAEDWIKDYQRAKKRFEEAEKDLNGIKNEFRSWTGDAGAAYLGDEKIVGYPEVSTKRIDVERLKAEYPEVAEAVTVSSRYRRMTIRVPKKYKLPDA